MWQCRRMCYFPTSCSFVHRLHSCVIYAPHSTLIITKLVIIYQKVHSHFWKIWFQEMHIHFHSVLCSQEMLISLRLGFRSVCGNYCFNFYENKSIYLNSIISNFGCVNKNKMYYFLSIFLPKYLWFWFVSTIPTLIYTMVSNIVVKITVVILNFIHNIWHRDTKVVPCILVLLKRADHLNRIKRRGRRGRDRMVVGFTTTCAISVFHH